MLPPIETWSNSKISFIILQKQAKLIAEDLNFLYQKAPQKKATAELTRNFKNLFLDKAEGSLPDWLTKALNKTSELQSFAKGIQKDFEAVIQVGMSKIILPKRNIFYFGCTMFLSIQILLEQPTLLAHIGFSI